MEINTKYDLIAFTRIMTKFAMFGNLAATVAENDFNNQDNDINLAKAKKLQDVGERLLDSWVFLLCELTKTNEEKEMDNFLSYVKESTQTEEQKYKLMLSWQTEFKEHLAENKMQEVSAYVLKKEGRVFNLAYGGLIVATMDLVKESTNLI